MERWQGRVALVTGASVGIGAAVSRSLVKHGLKVVGCARNVDKIKALAAELKGQPGVLYPYQCDVSKDEQVLGMFQWIKKELGGVDVCINNAGLAKNESLLDGTPEAWRCQMDVNVIALCLCTREAVKSMRERKVDDGQIVHISSLSAHRVPPATATHFYAATKHAVRALTEGLRRELREINSHIRVASLSPGFVETEFNKRLFEGDPERAAQPFKTMKAIQADEIAVMVDQILAAPPHVQIHDIIVRPVEQPA